MNAAKNWKDFSLEELQACRTALEQEYADYVRQKLKLNMARGKPAGTQLDLDGVAFRHGYSQVSSPRSVIRKTPA